jgi:hypothetical protein
LEIEAGLSGMKALKITPIVSGIGLAADAVDFLSSEKTAGDYTDLGVSSILFVAGVSGVSAVVTVPLTIVWLVIKEPLKDEINKVTGQYVNPNETDKKVYENTDNR